MRLGNHHNTRNKDVGVTGLIEYVMVSTIMMILMVVMLLQVNANFMVEPKYLLTSSEFTDIGNGVSTRIVEVYAIAPVTGNISSSYQLPDDILGQGYSINIGTDPGAQSSQVVTVSAGGIETNVSIAGISSSLQGVGMGNTTGSGINQISYNSGGV
jgi:hypothetical protein